LRVGSAKNYISRKVLNTYKGARHMIFLEVTRKGKEKNFDKREE
jgi:hypothetical protein